MITKVFVSGFRGLSEERAYDLNKVTFIVGKNGTGKSTLVDALKSALTGELPDNAVNSGRKDMVVLLGFDNETVLGIESKDGKTIHRLMNKQTTKKVANEERERILRLAPETGEILLGKGNEIINSKPDVFAKVISSIIRVSMPAEKLMTQMDMDASQKELARSFLPEEVTFDSLEETVKKISSEYTDLNRKITALKGNVYALTETKPEMTMDEIEEERKSILERKAKRESYLIQKKTFDLYMERLETKHKELEAAKTEQPKEEIYDTWKQISLQYSDSIAADQKNLALIEKNIVRIEDILGKIDTNQCPISCSLICTTDKTAVEGELKGLLLENMNQRKALQSRQDMLKQKLISANHEMEKARVSELAWLSYEHIRKEYSLMCANIPEIMTEPESITEKDDSERLLYLDEQVRLNGNTEHGKTLKQELDSGESRLMLLSELKKEFGTKGKAYNLILSILKVKLEDVINETSSMLGCGYEYRFSFEKGLNFLGRKVKDEVFFSVSAMSDGEKFLAQLLLLTAINRATGFGYILIDNIDSLDIENQEKVLRMATSEEFRKLYENILFAGVDHSDTMELLQYKELRENPYLTVIQM